jgi:hypothetical protein
MLELLSLVWEGRSIQGPVVVENKKDIVNVHNRLLLRTYVELVSFRQFTIDVLHNVSVSFTFAP